METKRINLTGNRSLINNKAHIDENWEKFSKNNSPYLRDALVPHYLKEETKNVASNIVFDKEGNKYYVDNDKFFVNDEAVADVSSTGFIKTDLEENYQCYDVNGPAYVKDDIAFYAGYSKTLADYGVGDILFSRVKVINDKAYFVIIFYDSDQVLKQLTYVLLNDGTVKFQIASVSWGQLVGGTTWTAVTDQSVVSSFRCNIAFLKGQEGDECVGITLIGNATTNNKESDLYFYNTVYDIDEEEFFSGNKIVWNGISGEQTISNSWTVPYTIEHTRVHTSDSSEWTLTDKFKISIPESAANHTNTPQRFSIQYRWMNQDYVINATMAANQKECTVSRFISKFTGTYDRDFDDNINTMFRITHISVIQDIGGNSYTKEIPLDCVTYNPDTTTEKWGTSYPNILINDTSSYVHQGEPYYITWEWDAVVEIDAPSTLCNVFEDSGYLRSVPKYSYRGNNINEFITLGQVFSLAIESDTIEVNFYSVREFSNTSTYTYFASSAFTLNQNFFEALFCVFDNTYQANKTHNAYVNSGLDREIIGDIGMTNDGTYPYESGGYTGHLWYTQYGAIAPFQGTKWRLLYNYGNVSNISWGESEEEGTILADWNTVDGLFYISCNETELVYKDVAGLHKITVETINKNIQLLENGYVLINTTSYLNCWDIKAKKLVHFASDYNNRCYTGWQASAYGFFSLSGSWKETWEANKWENTSSVLSCASGQNVNYAISGSPFTSAIFPPQNLYHVVKGKEFYCYGNNASVDVYYNLFYVYTIRKNLIKLIDSNLYPDAQYPLSVNNVNYFNLPLLLTLIKTHNNKDMVKVGTMFYPIQYYNDVIPIFIYSTLGGLDGATDMFVIQAQFYAVMNGKICAVSYAENVVSNVEAIIDVSGMQFIGYLPTFALFYSPKNKNIYSFTGDANLEKIDDASEIGNLKHALYNSFTKTIHVITDKGVCIIGDTIYMIEFPGIEEIFFTKNETILETENKIYFLAFEKLSDEYAVYPLIFETEFFGGLNDSVTTIYKWSMRFIKDSVANGKIKLSTVTLTDKGSETREKVYNVSNADWDKLTDSFYIQFCPENNKATAHKIRIESDFPLTSLIAQITTDGSLTAAKNTMKI